MDLNKIDKTWNEFSKLENIELKYKERNQGNVIQSHYLINYTNEIATFSFIGILWKSTEGQNTDKTSIIVEFENRLVINNFEFKTNSKLKDSSSKDQLTEFERGVLKDMEMFDGNSITLKDNFIRIDTDHIFSTIEDFKLVADLILKIKTTGNNIEN